MPPRKNKSSFPPPQQAFASPAMGPWRPPRAHHLVIEYNSTDPLAYNPSHRVPVSVSGNVTVRLVSFYGTPGQTLAVHLQWGSNTHTMSLKSGSPSNFLALICPNAAGLSTVDHGPAVHRYVPSGPTTLGLQFFDADLPIGPAAAVYPTSFYAILEIMPEE
jgi:hypothetical protein